MNNNKWRVIRITEYVSAIELTTAEGAISNRALASGVCKLVSNPAGVIRALVEDMLRASEKQEVAI